MLEHLKKRLFGNLKILVIVLVFLSLLFLSGNAHATPQDNLDRYCPLMVAIYSACSPELVMNYFMHYQETPRPKVQATPPKAIVASVFPTLPQSGQEGLNETTSKPCWYYTPEGWKKCRWVN